MPSIETPKILATMTLLSCCPCFVLSLCQSQPAGPCRIYTDTFFRSKAITDGFRTADSIWSSALVFFDTHKARGGGWVGGGGGGGAGVSNADQGFQ